MQKFTFLVVALFTYSLSFGQLRVVTNGSVGVGTTAPAAKLHVFNAGYSGLFVESANGPAQLRLRAANTAISFDSQTGAQKGAIQVDIPSSQYIYNNNMGGRFFWLTNNTRMVFQNGKLGVNNTLPSQSLDVNGSAFKNDGSTMWLTVSDKRLKKNISDYTDGLEEVLKINPVNFTYNGKGGTIEGKEVVGILAQEIRKIAPYMIDEIELADNVANRMGENDVPSEERTGTKTYLTYDANALPYMLVNAIQDQQELINEKNQQIATLENRIAALEDVVNTIVSNNSTTNGTIAVALDSKSVLKQNSPNPFNERTTINYTVSSEANNSTMQIIDVSGKVLKSVSLQNGTGQVVIDAGELGPGTYSYSLFVDGQLIETKKMLLVR